MSNGQDANAPDPTIVSTLRRRTHCGHRLLRACGGQLQRSVPKCPSRCPYDRAHEPVLCKSGVRSAFEGASVRALRVEVGRHRPVRKLAVPRGSCCLASILRQGRAPTRPDARSGMIRRTSQNPREPVRSRPCSCIGLSHPARSATPMQLSAPSTAPTQEPAGHEEAVACGLDNQTQRYGPELL